MLLLVKEVEGFTWCCFGFVAFNTCPSWPDFPLEGSVAGRGEGGWFVSLVQSMLGTCWAPLPSQKLVSFVGTKGALQDFSAHVAITSFTVLYSLRAGSCLILCVFSLVPV